MVSGQEAETADAAEKEDDGKGACIIYRIESRGQI